MKNILIFEQDIQQKEHDMEVTDDKRQKVFSEDGNANKELSKKVLEIMDNPPAVDQYGRKWDPLSMSLTQHFEYVLAMHPEIKKKIDKQTYQNWVDLVRPFLSANFCENGSPGNILNRKTLEICFEKGCSFREALSDACRQNPEIVRLYVESGYK
jgi:hypothetical protein